MTEQSVPPEWIITRKDLCGRLCAETALGLRLSHFSNPSNSSLRGQEPGRLAGLPAGWISVVGSMGFWGWAIEAPSGRHGAFEAIRGSPLAQNSASPANIRSPVADGPHRLSEKPKTLGVGSLEINNRSTTAAFCASTFFPPDFIGPSHSLRPSSS
ncbi:hypothetical protein KM043_003276 [Ampulex compressa]|nr:hypothetical protein KM043_003276 [Ampulex compressa]